MDVILIQGYGQGMIHIDYFQEINWDVRGERSCRYVKGVKTVTQTGCFGGIGSIYTYKGR